MNNQLQYILTKVPAKFGGKDNWLGVKMSPHSSMEFINEVDKDGVKTNVTRYAWDECPQSIIATIYQRMKLDELNRNTNK